MNENDNGGGMQQKVSTDKKIVKMFRRLEKFLDAEGLSTLGRSVMFQNFETKREFAVFLSPESFNDIREYTETLRALVKEGAELALEAAAHIDSLEDNIDVLTDDNALLAIIDAQNDVLQGRCEPEDKADVFD